MSGRVGVEQTPDIEAAIAAVLAEHRQAHRPQSGDSICDCEGWNGPFTRFVTDGRGFHDHVAQALAPVLAAAELKARAAELREAADDMPFGYSHAAHMLRDRADRIDVDAPEGGEGR